MKYLNRHKFKNLDYQSFLIIAIIILSAFVLRMYRLESLSTFGHDNSRDLILNYKMYEYGEWIYRGPTFSIIWGFMSPIYYYMLFPFHFLLGFHPLSSPVASMAYYFAAIGVAFYFIKKIFSLSAAIFVSLLLGFSFTSMLHSLEGLNPSLMPFFSILGVFSLYMIFMQKKEWYWLSFSLSYAFMVALHPAGVFIALPLVLLLIMFRPKIKIKTAFFSLGIFGLFGILPYLIQEKKMGFWTVKKILEYADSGKASVNFLVQIQNFVEITVNNLSMGLFNSSSGVFVLISALIMVVLLVEGLRFIKKRTKYQFFAFVTLFYLINFALLVKFAEVKLNEKWFNAFFVPIAFIYVGLLVYRIFVRSKFIGIGIIMAFLALNLYYYSIAVPKTDSYSFIKNATNVIRKNSEGEYIDVYGLTPDTVYYLLWLKEKDPELKNQYLSWVKWAKEKDAKLLYFIEATYDINPLKIESLITRHGIKGEYVLIATDKYGRKIYRIE